MDSFEKAERKREARHRLHAQRARAGRLRNRVIAISLVCFALLWGAVFVQMATGNDPVLSRSTAKTASATKAGAAKAKIETPAEPREAEVEPVEAEDEAAGGEFEAGESGVEAELEAELAQAEAEEAEALEAEAIELQAAEEELESVTSGQS